MPTKTRYRVCSSRYGAIWLTRLHGNLVFVVIAFFIILSKNAVILSLISLDLVSAENRALLGLDFFLLLALALLVVFRRKRVSRVFICVALGGLLLIVTAPDTGSMAQLVRLLWLPWLAFCFSSLLQGFSPQTVVRLIGLSSLPFLIFLCLEIVIGNGFYELINLNGWNAIKGYEDGLDYSDKMQMRVGSIVIPRLLGTTLHPITSGYVLTFLSLLVLCSSRDKVVILLTVLLTVPLLAVTSKGALALYFACLTVDHFFRTGSQKIIAYAAYLGLLLLLSSYKFTSGYTHLLALKSAMSLSVETPLGYYAGYLFKFDTYLALLIYNFGVLGFVYFAWLLRSVLKFRAPKRYSKIEIYIALCLINSILHVEPITYAAFFIPLTFMFFVVRSTTGYDAGRVYA